MKKLKKFFHTLSYLQYPLLLIGLFLLIKPFVNGFNQLWSNSAILYHDYNNALIFLGLALSFASLQDSNKTSLKYEKRIWQNPKKAKRLMLTTIFTMVIFFVAGLLGFIFQNSLVKEFSYGCIVVAIGLIGYLKLQMEIYENLNTNHEEQQNIEATNDPPYDDVSD